VLSTILESAPLPQFAASGKVDCPGGDLTKLAIGIFSTVFAFKIIPENTIFSVQIFKLALKIEAKLKGYFFLDGKWD